MRPSVHFSFQYMLLGLALLTGQCEGKLQNTPAVVVADDDVMSRDPEGFLREHHNIVMPATRAELRSCGDPHRLVCILVDAAHLPELLEKPFYLHTNPLETPDLLDYTVLTEMISCAACCGEFRHFFGAHFFWNQTSKMVFTGHSTKVESYLLLNDANIFNVLNSFGLDVGLQSLVAVANNMRAEERRTGLMFEGSGSCGKWCFQAKMPFYFLERNFNFTDDEIEAIKNSKVVSSLNQGSSTKSSEKEIRDKLKQYVATDEVGFGDTRVFLGREWDISERSAALVGGFVTLPTALPVAQGFVTGSYDKYRPAPTVNLQQLFDLAMNSDTRDEAIEFATCFLWQTLYRLTTISLQRGLGNEGHLGLGAFIEPHVTLCDCWRFDGHAHVEFLLPAVERRFFRYNPLPASAFSEATRHYNNPAYDAANIKFFNEQIVAKFFPAGLNVNVWPGLIFKGAGQVAYTYGRWNSELGLDFIFQAGEHFGTIQACPRSQLGLLDVCAGKVGWAYQGNIFGGVHYTIPREKRTWYLDLKGDISFVDRTFGKSFSVCLGFGLDF